ncbi:MAG: hypothetical protein O7G85_11700 [Planctomycetota bacterium]|nr:hypothetical protein [Planctomycetota bacterium]
MRGKKYLNFILTINAILLTCLLWVQVADKAMFSESAEAQVRDRRPGTRNPNEVGPPTIFPNDADQRERGIDQMKKMNQTLEALKNHIESGALKVEVSNADQFGG